MLSQRYSPLFGGAAVQARRLTAELRRRGWNAFVVTAGAQGLPLRDAIDDTPVFRVPTFGARRYGLYSLYFGLGSLVPLLLLVRRWSLLHVHGAGPFTWFPLQLARMLGRPVIVKMTLMGSDDVSEMDAGRFGWLNRDLFAKADAIVSISTPMSDAYRASGLDASKLHEMPQGVDVERFRPASPEERKLLRRRLGLAEDGPWLVCVGAVFRRKGTDVVVEAFLELAKERPTLRIAFVGMDDTTFDPLDQHEERAYSLDLKRRVAEAGLADRALFTGVVDNVEDYMRAADLFLFPSRREGFGTVMVEAMACGLPCIVNSIQGIAATVYDSGHDGVILDEAAPSEWAREIGVLLDDPERAARLGRAAREVAVRRYGFDVVCDRYEALYESLLDVSPERETASTA
jgi:glycosyltransferase involved in cell wall biosynthesis